MADAGSRNGIASKHEHGGNLYRRSEATLWSIVARGSELGMIVFDRLADEQMRRGNLLRKQITCTTSNINRH